LASTLYTNHPAEIATYAATLDELSAGRCILGLGMHTCDMVQWTGIDVSDPLGRTRECVDLVRRLLRGEVARNDSPVFPWGDQCYLRFKPLRADIPIYISAFGNEFPAAQRRNRRWQPADDHSARSRHHTSCPPSSAAWHGRAVREIRS
jgi:alkanesulfonate monooxygenase SsuD/methylene tetrahydromethanopterin reductase-like flavin-dependent oxidoreductase (luciferase family)